MRPLWWLAAPLLLAAMGIALAEEEKETGDGSAETAPGIAWQKDLATATETARKEGKPLLLYFTFDT